MFLRISIMQCHLFRRLLFISTILLIDPSYCQTPVIGGRCSLGTPDVQIGGKQTQFFLRCDAMSDSAPGDGVWVVKSRTTSTTSSSSSTNTVPISVENTQTQQRPKTIQKPNTLNICEQNVDARENGACAVSATCLQANNELPSSYLQCDQTSFRWIQKFCQDGFVFNFEQQTCVIPKRMSSLSHRCLEESTPNPNPCLCPYGYLCTSMGNCCQFKPPHKYCSHSCPTYCPSGMACKSFNNCCKQHTSKQQQQRLQQHPSNEDVRNSTRIKRSIISSSAESSSSTMSSMMCGAFGAECRESSDCPPTFNCTNRCCRLSKCPSGAKVVLMCTNNSQCRDDESCIFGGCCPTRPIRSVENIDESEETIMRDESNMNIEQDVGKSLSSITAIDPYTDIDLTENVNDEQHMPSSVPINICIPDNDMEDCDMNNPCPETSECISGQCCRTDQPKRCSNGIWPLTIPQSCSDTSECPIESRCEREVCCPFGRLLSDSASEKRKFDTLHGSHGKTWAKDERKTIDLTSMTKKFPCLAKHRCSTSRSLCPSKYTCTLEGRCCSTDLSCPDGTIPEAMCSENSLCPRSTHTCLAIDEKTNICCITRLPASGVVCTFSSCSNSNPCSIGTCNNGYCCSSSSIPSYVPSNPTSNCVGCAQPAAPQILALQAPICPGGGYPVGQCHSGYCSPGYSCHQNVCCPSYSPIRMQAFACPSGSAAVGTCVNGACATGYSCIQNHCCPTPVTKNPFVCPNGNQAAGGCVNGQCGAGYTCRNGLCCAGKSSSAVKCLDGSEAVGACIPSCYGDSCGGLQITYYCGAGYTCTTGNICCPVTSCPEGGDPIGPPVNGLCPQGYSLQGSLCCSNTRTAKCPDGSNGTQPVNDICPTGTTLVGNICCPSGGKLVGVCETPSMGIGPCTPAGCGVGYACDNSATNPQCCPVVNYRDPKFQIGPAVSGMCPVGYVAVYPPSSANPDGTNDGVCVDLQTVPGLCAVAVQSGPCNNGQCPTGFTCNTYADICCPTTTTTPRRHYVEQNTRHTHYGRPVHNYIPTRFETCYDGSIPFGRCINGLCGIGHKCQNGLCCSPSLREESSIRSICPNNEYAVSSCFPNGVCGSTFQCVAKLNLCCPPGGNEIQSNVIVSKETIRPIGARCIDDKECVGYSEGLSLCHAGVCQCSPVAYTQGIACVRRKHLIVNDSPSDEK